MSDVNSYITTLADEFNSLTDEEMGLFIHYLNPPAVKSFSLKMNAYLKVVQMQVALRN